jgi:hypothetical protein
LGWHVTLAKLERLKPKHRERQLWRQEIAGTGRVDRTGRFWPLNRRTVVSTLPGTQRLKNAKSVDKTIVSPGTTRPKDRHSKSVVLGSYRTVSIPIGGFGTVRFVFAARDRHQNPAPGETQDQRCLLR